MEDLYSIHPGISRAISGDRADLMKSRIASHPRYPSLLSAFIECRKVGARPEMVKILEEIGKENCSGNSCNSRSKIGADPELDEFMDSYCAVLEKYKEDISKPFDEAAVFLNSIEARLRNLCNGCITNAANNNNTSDEAVGSSEEELSYDDVETLEIQDMGSSNVAEHELKEMLLKKYSGYLSSLRKEFMKKRKKGKLPKDARLMLLNWWNSHYRWPYPTEEEKAKLAEITGLDQKQINNWFINQRKRHWKPSEDMRFALMEGVSGGASSGTTLYFDTGTIGPGTT